MGAISLLGICWALFFTTVGRLVLYGVVSLVANPLVGAIIAVLVLGFLRSKA